MFQEKIRDYFSAVTAKYLSAVDADLGRSNQHEIGGLVKAGFADYLGRPNKGTTISFAARIVYLCDEVAEPLILDDTMSWYDSRHANRSPEYRLYYKSNNVTEKINPGDFMLIAKRLDDSLLIVFAPANSTVEQQIKALFGIQQITDSFQKTALNNSQLLLPLRLMLDDLGISLKTDASDEEQWLNKIHTQFGCDQFPKTQEFSEFARQTSTGDINVIEQPDDALLCWMEQEEKLFRILEKSLVKQQLIQGFGERRDDVDAFIRFSLSVQNRRKSRVGHAFENHLAYIFNAHQLAFEQGGHNRVTENRAKPDFLFPSFLAYQDKAYPASSLRLLGAKTSCKDRWRQVLAEAQRIKNKHLITLEAAISETQTHEMQASHLQLVVPKAIHSTYNSAQQQWLQSLADFIDEVKHL